MNKPILCTGELRYTISGIIRVPGGQLKSCRLRSGQERLWLSGKAAVCTVRCSAVQ